MIVIGGLEALDVSMRIWDYLAKPFIHISKECSLRLIQTQTRLAIIHSEEYHNDIMNDSLRPYKSFSME